MRKQESRAKRRRPINCSEFRVLIGVVFLSTFPLFIGDARSYAQETPPEVPRDYDLSRLELSPERRAQVATALRQKDYKKAEEILVAETELDPKSLRAAKLLEFSGGLFFLDGQYVNSVIAWKKAEAIAPLDERTRFTL